MRYRGRAGSNVGNHMGFNETDFKDSELVAFIFDIDWEEEEEIEADISGYITPYHPGTMEEPPEGGDLEDVSVQIDIDKEKHASTANVLIKVNNMMKEIKGSDRNYFKYTNIMRYLIDIYVYGDITDLLTESAIKRVEERLYECDEY